jgi:hypothetical protein
MTLRFGSVLRWESDDYDDSVDMEAISQLEVI